MKVLRAGVSFTSKTAQTVILEHKDESVELQFLAQHSKSIDKDFWYLDTLVGLEHKSLRKNLKISIALDNASSIIYSFPMDSTLNQVEQNEQVAWELSQYIQDFKKDDFLHETHVLQTRSRQQIVDVLVVAVRRSLVYDITNFLTQNKYDIEFIDINHFSAELLLNQVYPEVSAKTVALIGVSFDRVDAGILQRGKLYSYRYFYITTIDDTIKRLRDWMGDVKIENMYLHGAGLSSEWCKAFKVSFGGLITFLNPFRRIRISNSVTNFDKFMGEEHIFAAAVGSALRL